MVRGLFQEIFWGSIRKDFQFLYGSQIHYDGQKVHFENLNFSSGKVIKKWNSRTNFQAYRSIPELPILNPGQEYQVTSYMTSVPMNRVLVQLDFYNRQNEWLETKVLRHETELFTYPEEAFHYEIKLINGGCHELEFSHLLINEIDEEMDFTLLEEVEEHCYVPESMPEEIAFIKGILPEE